jgi:large subunit ribosomal protein L25
VAKQIELAVEKREHHGKGAAKRLRKQGRMPAIVYGYQVEPTPVSVDTLELYHALHTDAGLNALIRIQLDGDVHLAVARDLQTHPVRGDYLHVDLIAVDKDSQILVEVPVHLVDDEQAEQDGGVMNQILYTVPIMVRPLEVPNYFEVSVAGMGIGDVKRVEDLLEQLPAGSEFDLDPDRTVVTVNAPVSEAELEALEEAAGVEAEEPELVGEEAEEAVAEEGEEAEEAAEEPAEGDEQA